MPTDPSKEEEVFRQVDLITVAITTKTEDNVAQDHISSNNNNSSIQRRRKKMMYLILVSL